MLAELIDLQTLFLLTGLVSVTTATVMVTLWRGHPDETALPAWTAGAVLVAVGYIGIGMRGSIPLLLSIPLANACVAAGHACFVKGIDHVTGRPPLSWTAAAAVGLAIAVCLSYFTYVQPSIAARMAAQFIAVGGLSLEAARRLLTRVDEPVRLSHLTVAGIFAIFGLALLLRVVLMPFAAPDSNLLAADPVHGVVFVLMLLFNAALMYCFPVLLFTNDITRRRQIEATVLAAQNQLEATLKAIPDLLFEMTLDGRYVAVYARDRGELAAAPEFLIGKTVHQVLPAAAAATVIAALQEAHATGRSHGLQFQLTTEGGNFWFELSVATKAPAAGDERNFIVLSRDITERKLAENSLRMSTERLNEAQRIANLGSWHLDLASGTLEWSEEVFRLFEIDPKRFGATYAAFIDTVHPEDREAVTGAYRDSLANLTSYEISHRLLMKDGRIKWVLERCTSEFDADGKALRSIGTVQDITERKLAEEELRIGAIVFESQEAMMVTDAEGRILRVNRAFCETTGYPTGEVVGQNPRLLQSGRHDAGFYREMWETIARSGIWQGEVWDRRKDGTEYPKWLTISSVKNEAGVVTHYVGTHFDITARKQAEEKINELAFFDQLTGLPNRTLLQDRLRQAMTAGSRSGLHGALLLIDLDNFKTLNDTRGHEAGDQLLKQVASRLRACVRECDTVARLGGDEFVVVLTELDADQKAAASDTEDIAAKIRDALNQNYLFERFAHLSSASIGATLFRGQNDSVDELMKQADLAMYRSKAAGRNAVSFFDPAMEAVVKERAALEDDLRRALGENQFLLQYQAQIEDGSRLTGAEVLLRWHHPRRGTVSPADFIPLAEETGVILPLGHWVLRTACAQLAAWAGQPALSHLTIAVNVSAHQFNQEDFVDEVLAVLDTTGANPQRLKLELTESLLVENVQDVIGKMSALRLKGVGFSLDDFGTGYSSLSYLKRLPLDQLKIDQSFVRDVLTDPNDAAIAQTVVALAASLGFGVIAEGVETAAQRDFLAASGCHAYQGYFFSKPLPLAEFEQFARKSRQQ